jgi:hypothetical protein
MTEQTATNSTESLSPTSGSAAVALNDNQQMESSITEFPWGEALTPTSARVVTQHRQARLVIIAGGIASGKSTLLSTIYENFYFGKFRSYRFAGSKSLLEFERICHDSHIASNRLTAVTERTKFTDEFRLLHLTVQNITTFKKTDILFSDVTGEIFEAIRDSNEECQRHTILRRCDHFVLLIDGAKISNPLTRGKEINDGVQIIRRLLDTGMLNKHTFVDVLFTKLDIINNVATQDKHLKGYIEELKTTKFQQQFGQRVALINCSEIAARPDPALESGLDNGHGINTIFDTWLKTYPLSRLGEVKNPVSMLHSRFIDRFILPQNGGGPQ